MKPSLMFKCITLMTMSLSIASFAEGSFAEADANAKIKVTASISLAKNNDLLFADAAQGAPQQILGATETGAARFTATGQPGRAYTVSFTTPTIEMKTGDGSTEPKDHCFRFYDELDQ